MRRHAIRALGVGLAVLAILGLPSIRAVAQTDSPTTAWSFEKVWIHGDKQFRGFAARGTLTVSSAGLTFHTDKHDLDIPTTAIRSVSIGHMKGDAFNDWAIVTYDDNGTSRVAGFMDGNGLFGGPDTVAIHDAIRRVLPQATASEASPPEGATKSASPGGAERPTFKEAWKESVQIQLGFPPAPNTLVTDPNSMGLLVVDGDVKYGFNTLDMDGVSLVRPGEDGVFRAGPASGLPSGCVIFTGLEPGDYVVKMARGSNGQAWAALPATDSPDFAIRIEAGKVHYLGQLHMKSKSVEKTTDPSREMEVWARFAKKYAGTPWAALAEARSRAVQGQ